MNPPAAGPAQDLQPTRRTRKRNERRDRVYAAAIALFVEQGFDETSMDDIAARSALSRTTVFNHFPRKALFLEEWALRRRQRAAASFGPADAADRPLAEVLDGYFAALATLNTESRIETAAVMRPTLRSNDAFLGHVLARDLTDLITAGDARLRPSADPAQVGRLLALGYYSAVIRWIHVEPAPFSLHAELSALVETVLRGALAP